MAQLNKALLTQIPSFKEELTVEEWIAAHARGELEKSLRAHWSHFVSIVYSRGHDLEKEQRYANTFLFHPMETFVCGGEPVVIFQRLKERDNPSQICGHVFRTGEPTYSCRDCANDPTCVLCINCFQKSKHRDHKYRMSTSGGGGYCDCGDPEAWKTEPVCDVHKATKSQSVGLDPLDTLPGDVKSRATDLFMSVLTYIVDLLTWEDGFSLPEGLQPDVELSEDYHCMLFNDEVHTYDQVIQTLQKTIDCTNRQAVDFATIVDREGRASIKQGTAADCDKVKEMIERNTSRHGSKPLKVMVMHNTLVAHQTFVLRCIEWLQTIINKTDGLRHLFCLQSMKERECAVSLMERLILVDTKLWKMARILSHQLLMAGVLKDAECKKLFAVIFTKHYQQMMQDFNEDDHDHDVSVTSLSVQIFTVPSLHYASFMADFVQDDHYRSVSITKVSVQIFTVPTLARMLITHHDLLAVIMNGFLKNCQEKKNRQGKLSFERNERSATFRRACYMLYDLKYALLCKPSVPEEWSDALRANFLNGFMAVLNLLKMMQGMDSVTRQTTQHLEFEPEWEGAFNLQLKLEDSLVLFSDWCSSDYFLLTAAYKETVEALFQCKDKMEREKVEVVGHTARCIKHDVSSQPVSIHLPVTRFFASIHVHLSKYRLQYNVGELSTTNQLDIVELMEPALRVQVLVAQTQASMWRRNGFSLLNQIYFYHNVRCREQMYDKDIVMLQIAASLLDSNEFLIHCLNKYGLVSWIRSEYDNPSGQEDFVRQTVTLAEEFLNMLIVILEERYVPGIGEVTHKDAVKREIIHQLCISPMPHSKLSKSLTEDPNHETGLEEVVEEVAVFKKPTVGSNGKYELKEKYYSEYCPFFYHYTKAEQSKSEEAQRTRKKQSGEDQALPPPIPPRFKPQFAPILNLFSCDVMMHILSIILSRTAASRSRSWSEAQFERVLYIIGLALQEQITAINNGDSSFQFLQHSVGENGLLGQLKQLVHSPNVSQEPIKDLLTWVLRKFGEALKLCDESSFKDQLESLAQCADLRTVNDRKKKAALAAKRRAKVMAQMSKMQKDFIAENAELFENTCTEGGPPSGEMEYSSSGSESSPDSVALGPSQSKMRVNSSITVTCILCQEEQTVSQSSRAMVLAAYVQMSTVLSQNRSKHLVNGENYDPLLMAADLFNGTHTSSCGHVMHHECWQRYFQNIVHKERRRPLRFRQSYSFDIDKMEYLCPLCEGLSNTVIPMIPALSSLLPEGGTKTVTLEFDDWLDGIHKTAVNSVQNKEIKGDYFLMLQPCPITTITRMMAESVARNFQLLWEYVYDDASAFFSDGIMEMMQKFAKDVYVFGLNVKPNSDNPRIPIMTWNTCAFTIMSFEQDLASEGQGVFGSLSERQSALLGALVRFAAVVNQVVPSETIREHCVRLLSLLIPEKVESLVYDMECLLDVDMFHFLVALTMTLPSLHTDGQQHNQQPQVQPHRSLAMLPTGSLNDQHALMLVFIVHLVQIMLTYDASPQELMETELDMETDKTLLEIYQNIRSDAGLQQTEVSSVWQLTSHIKEACLPFLRCAALFYHHLTGVVPPQSLHERSNEEFVHLCNYLALPHDVAQLFKGPHTMALVRSWCCCRTVRDRLSASSTPLVHYPRTIKRLDKLPKDYSELINEVSSFTCPKSEADDSRAPTRCLVCGAMLCSQSYCCQEELDGTVVGAATQHAMACGAGTGIFLRVRDCQILLLSGKTKGCFLPAPYVDSYGETDQGLRRGNPLTLSREQYDNIQKIWFQHAIPQTIARNLNQESNVGLVTIEWNNL